MEFPANAWVPGPFGLDALRGSTVRAGRTVLAVAHHVTAATRLADVMPLLETDRRVAVAYTASPASAFTGGLDAHLRDLGGLVVPWQQAVATRWDLVVAASHGMLEKLHGPVMTVLHGAAPASCCLVSAVPGRPPHGRSAASSGSGSSSPGGSCRRRSSSRTTGTGRCSNASAPRRARWRSPPATRALTA